jgi:hypothetical protein
MSNKIQIKRTSITGRTPNTTNVANSAFIDAGELAVNLTDRKIFSSNGSVSFEVGANLSNLNITGGITANGSLGSDNQVLTSNGTAVYWTSQVGPQGAQGVQGTEGSQGPQGFQGQAITRSNGNNVISRSSRNSWFYRATGSNGFNGNNGPTGTPRIPRCSSFTLDKKD